MHACNLFILLLLGLAPPPPGYAQPAWIMPTTNIGQAPPAYMANQGQPLWLNQPATANQGPLAAEARSTDTVPNETKERI